jgi:hypothetical protein
MDDSLLGALFLFVATRAYVGSYLGNVFCTMSGNALRLMSKADLVESCEKKIYLDVLHIELVIMYKLFLSLRVYGFVIKFFVTCCCEVVTVYVLTLVMHCC